MVISLKIYLRGGVSISKFIIIDICFLEFLSVSITCRHLILGSISRLLFLGTHNIYKFLHTSK